MDPDTADLFFVPAYGECYLYRAAQQLGTSKGLDDANGWFRNLTAILANERPWWNRTQVRQTPAPVISSFSACWRANEAPGALMQCGIASLGTVQGRDHIFVFPGARGPNIFKDWKRTIKKSIFLTPEGDRSFGCDLFRPCLARRALAAACGGV